MNEIKGLTDQLVLSTAATRVMGAGRILRALGGRGESEDEAALLLVADGLDDLFELLSDQLDDKADGAPGE